MSNFVRFTSPNYGYSSSPQTPLIVDLDMVIGVNAPSGVTAMQLSNGAVINVAEPLDVVQTVLVKVRGSKVFDAQGNQVAPAQTATTDTTTTAAQQTAATSTTATTGTTAAH